MCVNTSSDNRIDDPVRGNLADTVMSAGDINTTVSANAKSVRINAGFGCQTAVTDKGLLTGARDRSYDAVRGNAADAPIIIGEVNTAVRSNTQLVRIEASLKRLPVPAVSGTAIACNRRNNSIDIHFTDAVATLISNVKVVIGIQCDTDRI